MSLESLHDSFAHGRLVDPGVDRPDGARLFGRGRPLAAVRLRLEEGLRAHPDPAAVEGISERVAYLMAAGPGEASRIYKTEDGGAT
jgi:hypothetical protein